MPLPLAYHISRVSSYERVCLTASVGGSMSSGLCKSPVLYVGKYGCLLFDLYSS